VTQRNLGPVPTTLLGIGLLAVAVADGIVLLSLWPVVEPVTPGATGASTWSLLGWGPWSISRDAAFLLLVIVASILGSFVHAATSFASFAGNRRLYGSWAWWYLLRSAIGAALAILVYFAVRGGLFTANATSDTLNTYGVAAVAGLTGLFSKQATDKLRELFETLFATAQKTGDGERADKITNPQPSLTGVEPAEVQAAAGAIGVTLSGVGFMAGSEILLSRVAPQEAAATVKPTNVSAESMTVTVPADLTNDPGTISITVVNPAPGGGPSETVQLIVIEPAAGGALDIA
jgi:hypothetical protein